MTDLQLVSVFLVSSVQ